MEHKAKVVFTDDVWKQIEWFTYNFDTEIGALGIVKQKKHKDGNKYFYVTELLFPQQKVSGATVHFTPEMWGELLKERGLNGLKDVAFYWHRHPGGSAHSGTDDVDTFETFMSKEANRKYFIFLQTASNSTGWNQEARIDIRLPIRHTILDNDIDIRIEESPEDEELRKRCEAIAEKCIIKEKLPCVKKYPLRPYVSGYGYNIHARNDYKKSLWDIFEDAADINRYETFENAILGGRFGNIEGADYFDNDTLEGYATEDKEKVSITFENGQATIVCGKDFGTKLEQVLKDNGSKLNKFVRAWKVGKSKIKAMKKYNLQPIKGKYTEMKNCLTKGYFAYCSQLLKEIDEDLDTLNLTEEKSMSSLFQNLDNDPTTLDKMKIEGTTKVKEMLSFLDITCVVDWTTIYQATVYDSNFDGIIGELWKSADEDILIITGSGVCWVIKSEQLLTDDEKEEEE